jgi:hypothetical protein
MLTPWNIQRAVLQTLSNGGFIPIRLESKDSTVITTKLFKIETSSDMSIQATIAEAALQTFKILKRRPTFSLCIQRSER